MSGDASKQAEPRAAEGSHMSAYRNAAEFKNSADTARLRASSYAGRHALETWENEGGGPPAALKDASGEEDQILRSLGAALIMRWNTIPTKLQKELFEDASSIGDLLQADALKGQIARFLHSHKDDPRKGALVPICRTNDGEQP